MTDYMDVTTNAAVIPTIVAAETLGHLAASLSLAGAVARDWDDEVAEQGDTVTVGIRGALSANDKAAGSDVTVQDPTTTGVDVVLDKHKEVTFGDEDIARMFTRPNLIQGYAQDAALVLLEQVEADLAALYAGFSQTIDASAGLDEADFRNAQRLLNAAKAPQLNRWAHLHEDAFSEVMALDKVINSDYQGGAGVRAMQEGAAGFLYGFNIALNQNIVVATTCKNIFHHRDAMALAVRPMRATERRNVEQVVMSENDLSIRVTMSYNANALAEQMTVDMIYGVKELRDALGVTVSTTEV